MSIILHMITKNNAYGYLDCALTHNLQFFDKAFVVDDESTDDTVEVLRSHELEYISKPDFIPSAGPADEIFRFFAWVTMLDTLQPSEKDWVVSLDPDDLISGDLKKSTVILQAGGYMGAMIKCQYLWERDPPMKRIDGLWDSLSSVRIAALGDGDQTFGPNQRLPRRAYGKDCFEWDLPVEIINLGFLSELDKLQSFDRLSATESNTHIKSILEPAECAPIVTPKIWEGIYQ